jgi:GT2 family glycosyltransferase
MSETKLSVIILNYNGGKMLVDNVKRLWDAADPEWEIAVIDNASQDNSIEGLRALIPDIAIFLNTENIGFAAAHNQVLHMAKGEYILLLNPDVVTDALSITHALEFMDQHPDVAILGPKIMLPNGHDDPAAHRAFKTPATYLYKFLGLSKRFPKSQRFGHYYMTDQDLSKPCDVDSVTGAFLLIRSNAQKQIGLLDERFFMYCEDEDWCWRAKQAGFRVVYNPEIVVEHEKSTSAKSHPIRMTWVWHVSLMRYHRKNIAASYPAPVNALVYAGIGTVLAFRLFGVCVLRIRPE